MRFPTFVLLSWLATQAVLCGQGISFQQRQQLGMDDRIVQLEERLAARTEDVKTLTSDIAALKEDLKSIREQAIAAKTLSESNADRLGQITWVGRLILGAVAFLIGVIVTQAVSRFMTSRKPRIVHTSGA